MPRNFLTWNMQGAGSGHNAVLKWEQLLDYLNAHPAVDYVAFQEGGQESTYNTLHGLGFARHLQNIDHKIYNRHQDPEIKWQFDYFECSNDGFVNTYGVYFLSRYTRQPGGPWVQTLRVSLGIIARLPDLATRWMFVKFGDDISDMLRPPVGLVINDEFMIGSLHSTANGGFNTQQLIENMCDWLIGEGLDELYILGDFNINDLTQATLNHWLDHYATLEGVLQTVPIGGPGLAEQYTHYGPQGRRRLDYGVYIYDTEEPGDFDFQTVYYDHQQPAPPQNQPVPNPLPPGNHAFDFKSDHRPLLFHYEEDDVMTNSKTDKS